LDLKKNIITLTTDFGTRDYFSGAMKGVILGINPDARIIDISHEVASHDIWGAAYLLGAAYEYFPQYTIHVVVVDPGVGSQRRPVLAVTDKHYFIAPDNGVLSFVYADPGFSKVIHLTADHYFREGQGSTFNARDVFAPAAAWLSKGIEAGNFGEEITDYVRFNIPRSRKESNEVAGEIVYIDKFGNAITNITSTDVEPFSAEGGEYSIETGQLKLNAVSPFYSALKKGEPGAVINGGGFLEIFVCQGDARKSYGFKRGDKVYVKKA
jgi:S-adenosylmethionine hydrolase